MLLYQKNLCARHRHRQPLPAHSGLDAIAVLPLVLLVLHVVQVAEHVGLQHLVKVAEPRQVLGLMDGNDHANARKGSRGRGFKGSKERNTLHAPDHRLAAIDNLPSTLNVSIIL